MHACHIVCTDFWDLNFTSEDFAFFQQSPLALPEGLQVVEIVRKVSTVVALGRH